MTPPVRENRRNILRGSFGSSLATMLARFLGLFRVMLEARVLGGGALASTWQLAFMVPNLFRRLLGEGALSQALIPLLSHMEAAQGLKEVRRQLAVIFIVLTGLLGLMTVLISIGALLLRQWVEAAYVRDALNLMPLVMPYAIFICLVGVMTAVVNTRRVFFLASLNALLLNIVLLAVMYFGQKYALRSPGGFLQLLAYSVLAAGALQLLLLLVLLWRHGIFPIFRKSHWVGNKVFHELFFLALPGLIGGAASQVSFLVDRTLACWVGDFAVPALNYTERLVYLPIGIVAMALSSVLMADMSRAAAHQKYDEMLDDLALGMRYVWFFCAPLAIFLIVYREPVIRFFFMHGKFTQFNVEQTAQALFYYALGIPAFCATKVILPAFYARKKMTAPLKIALLAMVLNVIMSISLMPVLKQGGIALATVISSMLNNVLLLYVLYLEGFKPAMRPVTLTVFRSVAAGLIAAAPFLLYGKLQTRLAVWHFSWMPADTLPLAVCGTMFVVIYLGLSMLLRAMEPRELFGSLVLRREREK